jgi:glycosyltransferase involved in cell wall biosynthesis
VNVQTLQRLQKPDTRGLRVAVLALGGPEWTAGRVYVCNLLRALELLPDEERVPFCLVLPPSSRASDLSELGADHVRVRRFAFRTTDSPINKLRGAKRSLTGRKWPHSLEGVMSQTKSGVIFPALASLGREFPVPWVGWIPDFQHKRLPQFFSEEDLRNRDQQFQKIVDDARQVVVSSEDARRDLVRWFPAGSKTVSVLSFVSVSSKEWYEENPAQVAAQFGLPAKFLIFPSQFWIHKNHRVLFEAIRILRDMGFSDICLVSTGHTHDSRHPLYFAILKKHLEKLNLNGHVRILGLLPRQVQIQLLRRAVAVIQPSLFEGWSSLVEDARTLGKRIYVSDIPVHREQHPDEAVFFDPDRPEELAELLARDWPDLKPGPDLVCENEAHAQERSRAVAFARVFQGILARTTANGSR